MIKTSGLLLVGIAAGLLASVLLIGDPPPAEPGKFAVHTTTVGADEVAVDRQFLALREELTEQRTFFTERLEALAGEVSTLRASVSALGGEQLWSAPAQGDIQRRTQSAAERLRTSLTVVHSQMEEYETERLLAAGFAQERVEWIKRRKEELNMEATQRLYAARNGGPPIGSHDVVRMINRDGALRDELGDVDYERYLTALGRPTSVRIIQVLATSPAEQAGLRPGDEVVKYDGKRVFHAAELAALPLEGKPDQPVLIDIRRDGQIQQLVVPRRPLGIAGSFLDELISIPGGVAVSPER